MVGKRETLNADIALKRPLNWELSLTDLTRDKDVWVWGDEKKGLSEAQQADSRSL